MAKLKNPLFGFNVRGTLGRALSFRGRGSQTIAEKKPIPTDTKSFAQLSWRHMYQKAVALWHLLSAEEKQDWESNARIRHMTGFAWFMSQCLKPNPGIYLPLQGGIMQGNIDMASYDILNYVPPSPELAYILGATYKEIQDWVNTTQSGGRISGGAISDNDDGLVTVAAGTGFIKAADSDIALTKFFDWAEDDSVALADNATNYIYIDYNAGAPQILVTVDRTAIRITDQFTIGRVYRKGNDLDILNSGIRLYNQVRLEHERLLLVRGFERGSGGVISETDERYLISTGGVFYLGHNKITTAGKNTFVDDKFTAWYYNGAAWVPVPDQTQISNTQYNNIAAGLANLTANRYSVHWIYIGYDGSLHAIYGQGDYKLTEAEIATVPGSIPLRLNTFAKLAAKIIIKQNGTHFTSVVTAYETLFPVSSPSEHNDLGAIQGGAADNYYHLTSAEHGKINTTLLTTRGDMITRNASVPKRLAKGSQYQRLKMGAAEPGWGDEILTITFIIDGGGAVITTGQKGHLEIPFACSIIQATMLADQSGSIVVDIWKDSYANAPPDNADSITAAAPPTITTAQKSQDSTLTGWTKAIAAGDILAFNVDSCTTITRVTISLKVKKS